jgi:predicted dehydrogenase
MNTDKIRIAFVGVGAMGQAAHLRNFVTVPDCEVVTIAEARKNLGEKIGRTYNIANVYTDPVAMLESEAVDAIVASQPFTRHGQVIPQLYLAGKPILTEKPLAGSIEVAERMLSALKDSGSWHMVGYHKRSDPATMYAKEQIDRLKASGELGRMRYVRVSMPPGDWVANGFLWNVEADDAAPNFEWDPRPADMDDSTYQAYERFVNYYIHQVNLIRHLLGEPYKVTYADRAGVLLAGESESGITVTLEMGCYQTTVDWQESVFVAFEKGWLRLTYPAPLTVNRAGTVEVFSDPGNGAIPITTTPQLPSVGAMRQQAINFVRAVRGEIPPMCEAAEALEDLKVAREYIRLKEGR